MKVFSGSSVIEPYIKIDPQETQNTMVTAPKGRNDIFGSYAQIRAYQLKFWNWIEITNLSITAENIILALRGGYHRILRLM